MSFCSPVSVIRSTQSTHLVAADCRTKSEKCAAYEHRKRRNERPRSLRTTLALLKATDGNGESTLDEDDIWSRGKDSSSVGDISIGQRYSMRGNELAATSGTV